MKLKSRLEENTRRRINEKKRRKIGCNEGKMMIRVGRRDGSKKCVREMK